MEIEPKKPSAKGPADWFTGDVWIDPVVVGRAPRRVRVNAVHFTPGARTAWHSHALGQTLYVMEGAGLVQSHGDGIVSLRPGDVVSTPPDEWHWHGATPDHFMMHLSITEGAAEQDKPETNWGDHVSDAEYRARRVGALGPSKERIRVPVILGTSGWQYADWRGRLYPAALEPGQVAGLLLGTIPDRGGQQHLLSVTPAVRLRALAGEHPRRLRPQPQGQPLSHPRTPTAGAERTGEAAHDAGCSARIQAGPHSDSNWQPTSRSTPTPCAVRSRPSRPVSGWPSNHAMSRGTSTRCGPRCKSTTPPSASATRPTVGPTLAHGRWGYLRLHEGRAQPPPCYGRTALRTWAEAPGRAVDPRRGRLCLLQQRSRRMRSERCTPFRPGRTSRRPRTDSGPRCRGVVAATGDDALKTAGTDFLGGQHVHERPPPWAKDHCLPDRRTNSEARCG